MQTNNINDYDESTALELWNDFAEDYSRNYTKYGDESKKALSTFAILRALSPFSIRTELFTE